MTDAADVGQARITPGAGYGCKPGRNVPSKRLRGWHRVHCIVESHISLREYARALVAIAAAPTSLQADRERGVTATRWLKGKGAGVILIGSVRQPGLPAVRQ